jgi:RHS repeat-associated protein
MTSWGDGGITYSYAYYPTNEMKQMVGDGRTTLFGYSADGERVGTWDSVTLGITYVLRGLDNKPLRQYREYNGGWTWQKDWVYRDGLLLATVEPTGTKYFHLDHLGTPRRITNSSRAVIASHDYYPFGEEITASSQDAEALKFTGHERDLRDPTKTTDDLDYMHARFYNPWIGRFLSVDPIGGSPGAPQSWNRYSYVMNNPPNLVDPTGEAAKEYADALDRRADEAKEGYLDLAKDGVSQNDGSLAGIAVDTALNTVADVGQALTAAGSGLGDALRAGDALGEAVGGGAGVGETALAAGKDTLRIGMMATMSVGVARSTVGKAAIAAGERGAAAVTNGALQTQVGGRLIGKGGLLNSGQNLRIGFGRRGGQGVLRVGGRWVERLTGRKHWDLVTLGDL